MSAGFVTMSRLKRHETDVKLDEFGDDSRPHLPSPHRISKAPASPLLPTNKHNPILFINQLPENVHGAIAHRFHRVPSNAAAGQVPENIWSVSYVEGALATS